MSISISIVTYNSANEILEVLKSLECIKTLNPAVFVVDNCSSDNTVNLVKEYYPDVVVIESDSNLGFGAGHNLAIRQIESDYHFVVNPDIHVEKQQIENMISFMNDNPDVVLLSPKVLNSDGSEQFLPRKKPSIRYCLGGRFEHKSKVCKKWRDAYTLRNENITEPTEIDFCTGCFMLFRSSTLKQSGGFDENYFLYFEDADITLAMQKYGKTVYLPSVNVVHEWQRGNTRSRKGQRICIESMMYYFKKWGIRL